jgi:hypothetical protein
MAKKQSKSKTKPREKKKATTKKQQKQTNNGIQNTIHYILINTNPAKT